MKGEDEQQKKNTIKVETCQIKVETCKSLTERSFLVRIHSRVLQLPATVQRNAAGVN